MNGCFAMKYNDSRFIIPKSEVVMRRGFGVVHICDYLDEDETQLIGIVDANYNMVMPLVPDVFMPKIYFAPKGNLIFLNYDESCGTYIVMRRDSDGMITVNEANDYYVVDDEKGIVVVDFDNCIALYDVVNDIYLTPFYSVIGPFVYSEEFGCKVAKASYYQEDENGVVDDFSTVISTSGEVLVPFKSLATGEVYMEKDISDVLASNKR